MNRIEINMELVIELLSQGLTHQEISEKSGYSKDIIRKRLKELGVKSKYKHQCSEESRKIISDKRKKWLQENPDKHPWRNKDKFKSQPCEKAKEFLKQLGVNFISEYLPEIKGRNFSIDIALPDKMIAIEINGNQHYERSGELKDYYKDREKQLENVGWKVHQVHYSACFNLEKWKEFFEEILNSDIKVEFDYFNYVPRENKSEKEKFCSCGNNKSIQSKKCIMCHIKESRLKTKVNPPTKEILEKLIFEKPTSKLVKLFKVGHNTITKWCKRYGIEKPKRGYWQKKVAGKL